MQEITVKLSQPDIEQAIALLIRETFPGFVTEGVAIRCRNRGQGMRKNREIEAEVRIAAVSFASPQED